jgi:septum formation protein
MMSDFVLASASKSRLRLLGQAHFIPKKIIPADVDETPLKKEKPRDYVLRISKMKAAKIAGEHAGENVLAADTIVVLNNKIIQKLKTKEDVGHYLRLYSGRNVKVMTGVCFINKTGLVTSKLVESKIKFKHINENDIADAIRYGDDLNCAGGIKMESFCEVLVKSISGSYSNIIGLPLYEARNILTSNGVKNSDS